LVRLSGKWLGSVCSALLAGSAAWSAAAPQPIFPGPQFEAGARPVAVATGDFDRDGAMDAAAVNELSGDVTLLFGDSLALLRQGGALAAGAFPTAILAVDLDGDGALDLAVANSGSDDLSLFLGRGDGTFEAGARLAVGSGPLAIAAADFDGDGRLDLVSANGYSDDLSLLLGAGGGSFAGERRLPAGAGPLALAVADFDGDGRPDLVLADWTSEDVAFLRNRGDGTFLPPVSLAMPGAAPVALGRGDFNRDGNADLAVGTQTGGLLSMAGSGNGTFAAPVQVGRVAAVGGLLVARADGDATDDLVATDRLAGSAFLFPGRGDGSFAAAHDCGGLSGPAGVAVGDFDADGTEDLVVANGAGNSDERYPDMVSVLLGRAGGGFVGPVLLESPDRVRSVTAGDLDGDGIPDLAMTIPSAQAIEIRRGLGDGTFDPGIRVAAGSHPDRLVSGDFDGDGRRDVAVADGGGAVLVYLSLGDGLFTAGIPEPVCADPIALQAGDLDGDGALDLLAGSGSSRDLSLLRNAGGGLFQPETRFTAGLVVTDLAIADLDRDGRPDIVSLNYGDDDATVLFASGVVSGLAVGTAPNSIAAGDLNQDGWPDLAFGFGRGWRVTVQDGAGGGAFRPETVLRSGGLIPASVLTADLDADGRLDLVAANQGSGNVSAWLSGSSGALGARLDFGAGGGAWRMIAADFDGDGRVDVAAPTSRGVVVLLNQGPFPAHDADGDGIPDASDNCPTVRNPDQDAGACDERIVSALLRLRTGSGSNRVSWSVTHEVGLSGFNLVTVGRDGTRTPINASLIRCRVCTGGGAADYGTDVARRFAGADLFIEMVRLDGSAVRVGPLPLLRPSQQSLRPRRPRL
jgi:hypothetical protein